MADEEQQQQQQQKLPQPHTQTQSQSQSQSQQHTDNNTSTHSEVQSANYSPDCQMNDPDIEIIRTIFSQRIQQQPHHHEQRQMPSDTKAETNASNNHSDDFYCPTGPTNHGSDLGGITSKDSYEIIPMVRTRRFPLEVLPDDTILDAPSLIAPLLLKKTATDISRSNGCNTTRNNRKPIDNYVRLATIASLTHTKTSSESQIMSLDDYHKSSAGQMLLSIGLSRVREFNLQADAKKLSRKILRNVDNNSELAEKLESIKKELSQTQIINQAYKPDDLLTCPHCPFKTEFSIVISGHAEVPHVNKRIYSCNWCSYKSKDTNLLVYHNLMEHKKRCRIEKEPSLHSCGFCEFECKSKRQMVSHVLRCQQFFPHQNFLGPQYYSENGYPAVTSKLITQEDVRAYEQVLKALRLAAYNPHQLKVSTGSEQQTGAQLPLLVVPKPSGHNNSTQVLHLISAQQAQDLRYKTGILQHPKQNQSCFMNGKSVLRTAVDIFMAPNNFNSQTADIDSGGMKDVASSSSPSPKSGTFVICEICDSYIKDLSQLKLHMDTLHKVRIHSRTLESRPPLNCQKCQWRFFTDQGLERHLLGAHALVTSNMQELVDDGTDGGRCSVCGRAFANKLVAHMREVHKANLKPAHLSYKCTVCAATFNLYRLFENHVYTVHSESVRRCSGK